MVSKLFHFQKADTTLQMQFCFHTMANGLLWGLLQEFPFLIRNPYFANDLLKQEHGYAALRSHQTNKLLPPAFSTTQSAYGIFPMAEKYLFYADILIGYEV